MLPAQSFGVRQLGAGSDAGYDRGRRAGSTPARHPSQKHLVSQDRWTGVPRTAASSGPSVMAVLPNGSSWPLPVSLFRER